MGSSNFNNFQKISGLLLVFCAFMIIPLSLGAVVLNQVNKSGKQVSAQVAATNKCDLNKDGLVDKVDLEAAAAVFGKVTTDAGKLADIDGNGWVNSLDMLIISRNDPAKCQGISGSPLPSPFVSPFPSSPAPSPTPGGTQVSCGVNQTTIQAGNRFSVSHKGFAQGESIRILGSGGQTTIGITQSSLQTTVSQFVSAPASYPAGQYRVVIATRFPVVTITCGTINLTQQVVYNRCDFNKDGAVNSTDQELLGSAFNSSNSTYDLNSNGIVNSQDQLILATYIANKTSQYCI